MKWQDRISVNPAVRSGKPCIKGTRITVYDVLSMLSSGMSHAEIQEDFPELSTDDILAVLAYAADREDAIEKGASVVVVEYHPPRTVIVTRM